MLYSKTSKMAFWALFIILSASFTPGQTESFQKHRNQKRILISDPAVIENKFQEMERKFQTLESTVNTLTPNVNTVMATVNTLTTTVNTLTTNVNTLTTTVNNLTTNVNTLTTTVNNLKTTVNTLTTTVNTLTTKLNTQNQEMQNLATRLTHHEDTDTGSGGAIYVRWGRNDCPNINGTELVYSGYAGGSPYNEDGSAADYVCLPPDPQYGSSYDDAVNNRGGHMYGAEYQDAYFGSGYKTQYDDVPCAVCRSSTRSTYIMIPGRNTCYTGWTQEYSGNLASGHYPDKSASQFVCVDENPVPLPHGINNDDGKLFFAVEGICGSLVCPPYVNGRELTCVVCTK